MAAVNINDIAKVANVSRATVSRVLNNSPEVSETTKQKVLKVIEELNYVPNAAARTLVRRKTDIIGVLVNNVADAFWGRIIRGIETNILKTRYNAIFVNCKTALDDWAYKPKFKENIRLLTEGRVDGIIIATTNELEQEDIEFLTDRNIPFVVIQDMLQDKRVNFVNIDNFKGAYTATKYLINLGHRDIVHITGPLESRIAVERSQGFEKALLDHGIPLNNQNILRGNFRYNDGYWRMKQILSWGRKPTAIFFGNDLMAYGGMQAAKEANVRIPEDMSIIGFDGLAGEFEFAGLMPPLTTMHQPMTKMGECAAQIIIDKIDGVSEEVQHIFFDVELIKRDSCRSLK